jgi:hypothetical protein
VGSIWYVHDRHNVLRHIIQEKGSSPGVECWRLQKIHCGCNHSTGCWSFSLDLWMFGLRLSLRVFASAGGFDTFFVFFMRGLTSISYNTSHKKYKKKCQTLLHEKQVKPKHPNWNFNPSRMVASTMDLLLGRNPSPGFWDEELWVCLSCYCVAVINTLQWRSRNSWRAEIWNPFCLLKKVHTWKSTPVLHQMNTLEMYILWSFMF